MCEDFGQYLGSSHRLDDRPAAVPISAGSLAMLAAIRRVSSHVSTFRLAGLCAWYAAGPAALVTLGKRLAPEDSLGKGGHHAPHQAGAGGYRCDEYLFSGERPGRSSDPI